jgi:hypothetical protein
MAHFNGARGKTCRMIHRGRMGTSFGTWVSATLTTSTTTLGLRLPPTIGRDLTYFQLQFRRLRRLRIRRTYSSNAPDSYPSLTACPACSWARPARLTAVRGTNHEPNFACGVYQISNRRVGNDSVGDIRAGSGRFGTGCRYRPGRARFRAIPWPIPGRKGPISMVPGAGLAGERRGVGHGCLPHLVLGRLRVPGESWSVCLRGRYSTAGSWLHPGALLARTVILRPSRVPAGAPAPARIRRHRAGRRPAPESGWPAATGPAPGCDPSPRCCRNSPTTQIGPSSGR